MLKSVFLHWDVLQIFFRGVQNKEIAQYMFPNTAGGNRFSHNTLTFFIYSSKVCHPKLLISEHTGVSPSIVASSLFDILGDADAGWGWVLSLDLKHHLSYCLSMMTFKEFLLFGNGSSSLKPRLFCSNFLIFFFSLLSFWGESRDMQTCRWCITATKCAHLGSPD